MTTRSRGNAELWQRMSSAFDAASDPVVVSGAWGSGEGVVLYVNPAWTKLTGFTMPEMLGRPALFATMAGSNNMEAVRRLRDAVSHSSSVTLDAAVIRKDGKPIPAQIHASTIRFPDEPEPYLVTAQIPVDADARPGPSQSPTEAANILSFDPLARGDAIARRDNQRQAEQLIAAQQAFQSSLDSCPFGVQRIDLTGRILYANPIYHDILGFAENELIGESLLERLQDADHGLAFKAYLDHLRANQPTPMPIVASHRRKDGSLIDLRLDWAYERTQNGAATGLVIVATPVSRPTRPREETSIPPAADKPDAKAPPAAASSDAAAEVLQQLRTILHASRNWVSILTHRHPEDADAPVLARLDGALREALHQLGVDRTPQVAAAAYYEETRPLVGLVVVMVEAEEITRTSTSDLLTSWGCHPIAAAEAEDAVTRLRAAGRLPDVIVTDLVAGIGLAGPSVLRTIAEAYGPGIPAVLLAEEIAPDIGAFAEAVGMKVLQRPVFPIELRSALLSIWPGSRKRRR